MSTQNGHAKIATNGAHTTGDDVADSVVSGHTSQGVEIHAKLLHLTRFTAVFEVYNPDIVLRTSEVLNDFKIAVRDSTVYSGRAVVNHLVSTTAALICEATLEDFWLDMESLPARGRKDKLQEDLLRFFAVSQKTFKILPEFKVAVADLQMLLMDLRSWLEKVELGIQAQPAASRSEIERDTILAIQEPIVKMALQVLENFERTAQKVEPQGRAAHMSYMKRQIHPLVLCSPFIHRTFYKPLGYAGDYEMVNMMVRDPYEGGSLFAKIINRVFLSTPPVEAHRDRLTYLTQLLREETLRCTRHKREPRIFNLGCGPAKEVQDFLTGGYAERKTHFTLIDFNDETVKYTSNLFAGIKKRRGCVTEIEFLKKSVNQVIKESLHVQNESAKYDVVYCAGLFDYLPDPVCKRLLNIFYDMVAPEGLLVATNVADSNPSKNWMDYVLDWHLNYRNAQDMAALAPDAGRKDMTTVRSVGTGVNIFLEVRKPDDAQ